MIKIKRAYEPAERSDGGRFLVDRIWPRGVKKEALDLDEWLKDAAPSTQLRQWFGHDPARWTEFQQRYRRELASHPDVLAPLLDAARHGDVTLVYSAHDAERNQALVLKHVLDEHLADAHASHRISR